MENYMEDNEVTLAKKKFDKRDEEEKYQIKAITFLHPFTAARCALFFSFFSFVAILHDTFTSFHSNGYFFFFLFSFLPTPLRCGNIHEIEF